MYDPCGSQRIDGEEIIKRLALYFDVTPSYLERILKELAHGNR